ncbi:hypothetical protein ZWY2020_013889 [Hordeum vulgare]|nr:hypothetical protein ZWY2020_013889 [Hordeum vulgare]
MDSVKEPEIETESWMGIEKMANDLGDVLSRHLGILRREISFLRTEATLRSRDSAGTGKKACQEQQIRNVNLPYLATLSPMQFTASTPGIFPFSSVAGPALEIYSIRLVNLNPNLSWPIDSISALGKLCCDDDHLLGMDLADVISLDKLDFSDNGLGNNIPCSADDDVVIRSDVEESAADDSVADSWSGENAISKTKRRSR